MKSRTWVIAAITAGLSLQACASAPPLKPEVQGFVDQMVARHGFDAKSLASLMARAQFRQSIIDAISRPAEAKPWYEYRPIFVTRARAEAGTAFWRANESLLEAVARDYGVPPEIIVSIIGVETRYGGNTGRYKVLDALTTLAFGYPKRGEFFRSELEQFLLLSREEKIDPDTPKGSYAGAMGKPQFISSSYRRYAVDFDGDGSRDLWESNADVIASVANYFKQHGWRQGEPVSVQAIGAGTAHQGYVEAGMKPSIRIGELAEAGITAELNLAPDTQVSLIRLDRETQPEYWLGLHNFYVITRYNHSNLYAMAVFQLSREILALKESDRVGEFRH